MSSQIDSQNPSAEVEVDIQEPDCHFQTSRSSAKVIALNVLPSLVVGPSGKDKGPRFYDTQIGNIFFHIRSPLLENISLPREMKCFDRFDVLTFRGIFAAKINFTKMKKNPVPAPAHKTVQTKISLKVKSPPLAKEVVIKEPSPNSVRPTQDEVLGKDKEKRSHLSENHIARAFILVEDQNCPCEDLSATIEKYMADVEEYKKKGNNYCSISERLMAEVERRTNELENLRKNPEAERLKLDVHRLVNCNDLKIFVDI
ncbi:hypothetical protein Adt_11482 [Abeliophyllum distichum]|uniref:Uncharacterized protein n=1 Tax=Abeliophyllum distichum TaxID=126358 RepID=A0ABD1UPP6_9LAMI